MGQPDGQVDRFGAAVHQQYGVEAGALGESGEEALAVVGELAVKEAGVRGEEARLVVERIGHGRVCVSEPGHVVDHVDVRAAGGVDEVVSPAALDLHRALVIPLLGMREDAFAPLQLGRRCVVLDERRQSDQPGWVAGEPQPGRNPVRGDQGGS
nr:hypothetical protein [Streptomyces sp. NBRC 110028]